ncbi:MAG: NAD(P)H-dependent glycerol-3-phosphate dehydrogenase [bacterium]|nr:NAD(P)H-dependent glycerol-3-phosphate dehydrogenase [bacterium]
MRITILGTGAYGLALAIALNHHNEITMWTKLEQEKKEIETTHKYERVLPNTIIPKEIKITTSLEEALKDNDLIICAIPIAFIDNICQELKLFLKTNHHIAIASKGIEQNTCLFVNEIMKKHLNTNQIAVISGPSFAIDVVKNTPIGLTVGTANEDTKQLIINAFNNSNIKLEISNDVYGIEICGALKNIFAIACGILDGLKANESTKALLLTEAIYTMQQVIESLGGNPNTIISYAGFGDLLLTCTSTKSRNFTFGNTLVTGTKEEIQNYQNNNTIEGLYTIKSMNQLLTTNNITSPLLKTIYEITINHQNPNSLLTTINSN